jgi:hypothetical protein
MRNFFERFTKPSLLVSAALAAAMQLWLLSEALPRLWIITAVMFVAAWVGGRWQPKWTRRTVAFSTYLVPAPFIAGTGEFQPTAWIVWIVMVHGVMLSASTPRRWSLPGFCRVPLAFWGVLAASTWPIIMCRQSDFELSEIPSVFGAVSANAALMVITGILWLDWLFSEYSIEDRWRFQTEILLPLGMGWMVAAGLATYQTFGRMTFLNPPFWAGLYRATGSLADANLLGVVSALWGPAIVGIAAERRSRTWWAISAAALPLSWVTVWASGSRSSMPLVLLGLVGILYGLWRSTRSKRQVSVAAATLLVVAGIAAIGVARSKTPVVGPVTRLVSEFRPSWSSAWARTAIDQLRTRNGYGVIAADMIQQSPLVGIGLGAFNPLVDLYSQHLLHQHLPPDNAQNWFRHQIAEVGVIGSIGWIAWCASFLILLITTPVPTDRPAGHIVRSLLIGFGLISLVGVPAQNIAVALTFWTFAFWCLGDIGRWRKPGERSRSPRAWAWAALWVLVFAHAMGTVYAGVTFLRPPVQAMRAGADYSSGLYAPEDDPPIQWTKRRAVATVPVTAPWMAITVRVNYDDLGRNPFYVKVWADRTLVLNRQLKSIRPVTTYVFVGSATKRVMLETWVSRVVHPRELGGDDPRELGCMVRWTFLDARPPDAETEF